MGYFIYSYICNSMCLFFYIQINSYIEKKNLFMNNSETKINSKDSTLIINNNSKGDRSIRSIINTMNTEATVTNESYLDLSVDKDSKSKVMYNYNVRYRIYNNDFVSSEDETAP